MIEQKINLYQDRFKKKRLIFSAAQVVGLTIICLLGMAFWSYTMETELDAALHLNVTLKERQESISDELNAANAELARLIADNRIDNDIAGVTREITARRRVLSFVDANQFGSGEGFSDYLVSLSNLHVENLWLDKIILAENYLRIHGSALNAELIPMYFDQFSEEPIFKGNRFDIFQVEREPLTDWKVDFEIATSETLDE
ncbi:MAG: hypothetical protein OEY09_07705 [Gammaproteobacteria bacterium]|nr:hypothetical protein [Gammaproteobacteria bacterium]